MYESTCEELMKKLNPDQRLIDLDEFNQIKSDAPEWTDEYYEANLNF
jgi:hypothetical protein